MSLSLVLRASATNARQFSFSCSLLAHPLRSSSVQVCRNFSESYPHSSPPNKSKSFSLRITPAKPNGNGDYSSTGSKNGNGKGIPLDNLILYVTHDSPPCFAAEACLKYLKLNYETVGISLEKGEQFSLDFLQKNPNGEVPCLEDNGFYVSESTAVVQYLADKYKKNETFYPWDPQQRARINQLLAFNNTTLYRAITDYWINTTFFAYPKLELNLKKLQHAVKVFNNLLGQNRTFYAAGTDKVTIADVHLLMSQICLDGIDFTLTDCPNINKWYKFIQENEAEIWRVAQPMRASFLEFRRNPPDEPPIPKSHPIHPCKPSEFC